MTSRFNKVKSGFFFLLLATTTFLALSAFQTRAHPIAPPIDHLVVTPEEGYYDADLNWVRTIIRLSDNGFGKVTILVNCTPLADHKGMYLHPLVENEAVAIVKEETFAINHNRTLALNYTAIFNLQTSYLFTLKNRSALYFNETVLYQLTYTADFFSSNQMFHYNNDPNLISISLKRPTWDGTLDFQELEVILPIDVGQDTITSAFLAESQFAVDPTMLTYYQVTNSTTEEDSHYWFTITARKENLGIKAPFDVTYYLTITYFSLPRAINWLVISLVFTLLVLALVLYIVIIAIQKHSKQEVTAFKKDLYNVLRSKEDEPTK